MSLDTVTSKAFAVRRRRVLLPRPPALAFDLLRCRERGAGDPRDNGAEDVALPTTVWTALNISSRYLGGHSLDVFAVGVPPDGRAVESDAKEWKERVLDQRDRRGLQSHHVVRSGRRVAFTHLLAHFLLNRRQEVRRGSDKA